MSRPGARALTVLLATAALIGAANLGAYAANGAPLLGGRPNTETRATILRNTGSGPALRLRSAPGTPSLTVSSSKRVAHLNADLLDGLQGAALQSRDVHFVVPQATTLAENRVIEVTLPPGQYLMSYSLVLSGSPHSCFIDATPDYGLTFATQASGASTYSCADSFQVTVPSSGKLGLTVHGDGTGFRIISAADDVLSTLDFVRTDRVTTGSLPVVTGVRGAPGRSTAR